MRKGGDMTDDSGVDFLLAAYLEEGRWQVESLPLHLAQDLDALVRVLRERPGDSGALALISVDEDFFVIVRVSATDVRYLLSDVTAATEWPLARAVVQSLGLPLPEDEEQVQPAGDLGILSDFGIESIAIAAVCDQIDLYPEDMLSQLTDQMGFGGEFDAAVETTYG